MEPYFLVATPQIQDPLFKNTVIFMIEHNEEGAIGFIINKPLHNSLNFLFEQFNWTARLPQDQAILTGGPVGEGACFLVTESNSEHKDINEELIQGLIDKKIYFEMILGYSGWGAGQLEEEIKEGSWLCSDISLDDILAVSIEDRYSKIVEDLGLDLLSLLSSPSFDA